MYQEGSSRCNLDSSVDEECHVEHCFFPWKVKSFSGSNRSSTYLGTLFSASDNHESHTLWHLDLNMSHSENEILIELTRLKSKMTSQVFVRFHWKILDVDGNKVFPGSIHAFAYPGETISKMFVPDRSLLENKRFFADGYLRILCELFVYWRNLEEKISSSIRKKVLYGFCVLSEDMERLFLDESAADLWITVKDGEMHCHKSILSARSAVFRDLLRAKQPADCHLDLGELKADVLHAILLYLYCGNIDMYLKHTIPRGLFSEAKKYGLRHLERHLECIDTNDLTRFKSVDVTWKLPFFSILVLQSKVVLYCPEPNSNTLYDDRWSFKLEFNDSRDDARISVVRKQDERSTHHVQFVVRIETFEKISFEKTTCLLFEEDGTQGMNKFLTKDELSCLISSDDTLVIKCSLQVLKFSSHLTPQTLRTSNLSSLKDIFSVNTGNSLEKLSEDLLDLFTERNFSDTVAYTALGELSYHSYIAETRFLIPPIDLKAFVENLDPSLLDPFFMFVYGGELSAKNGFLLQKCALRFYLPNIASKISEFLEPSPGVTDESESDDDDRDIQWTTLKKNY